MIILIHSSKTMRAPAIGDDWSNPPQFLDRAEALNAKLKQLSVTEISDIMHVSDALAIKTHELIKSWTNKSSLQRSAIDSFLGDIYSGLQVQTWSKADRAYADEHLRILSGLYGIIQPLDGIHPYRLEMGYGLTVDGKSNLYEYWGDAIAHALPTGSIIINLAAVEYSKIVTKYINTERIIAPSFLTINPKTFKPTFVAVHTKITRGAFAGWLIKNRIDDLEKLKDFADLGYTYNSTLSTPEKPVFICKSFKGLGLSVRLT